MAKANNTNTTGTTYSCTPDERTFLDWLWNESFGVTLGKRDGSPQFVSVPVRDFPPNVLQALFAYGVQRKFNDAVGGADKTVDDKVTAVNAMIADYREGKVARARGTGESVDPMVAEIRTLLRPDVKAAYNATHDAGAWKGLEEDAIIELLDDAFESQSDDVKEAIRAQAQANLDAKEAMRKAKAGLSGKIKLSVA